MTFNIYDPIYTNTNAGGSAAVYTVTAGAGGAGSGATIVSNGSSLNWNTISTNPNIQGKTLHVDGSANITGELTVGGVKLSERLDQIEQRLNILRPNEELEEKWENLRALGQAYRELEKEILEKQEMWAILKK